MPWYGHGFEPADPAWGAAFTLLPYWVGEYYRDDQIFARHYAGITAHLESLIQMASGALLPGGANDPHPGKHGLDGLLAFGAYGDWCPAAGCVECQDPRKDATQYNSALVASFYYISELRIVRDYAATLGRPADAKRYGDIAANASASFMRHFYDAANKTFREARACTQYLSPQTSISLGHLLGLLPPADAAQITEKLVDSVAAAGWHVDTGIVGVKHLLPALSVLGRTDVALRVMQTRSAPSYGHMIEQGATTLWEQWGYAESPSGPIHLNPDSGASLNHVMFASCSAWFFQYLAGIRMAPGANARGWQRIELYPRVWIPAIHESICVNLSHVSASIVTPRGLLKSEWSCDASWAPPPPPPHCLPLLPRFAFVATNDTMCVHTQNKSNCGVFFEDKLLHTKHHVVSCAMCTLTPCRSRVTVDISHIAGLRTGAPFNCTMCGAPPPPPAPPPIAFFYGVMVPVGSIATVTLPTMGQSSPTIDEGNRTVWEGGKFVGGNVGVRAGFEDAEGGTVSIEVGGGSYEFRVLR